jgi:hypothetical protein
MKTKFIDKNGEQTFSYKFTNEVSFTKMETYL